MKDEEATNLTEQLRLIHEQTKELAVQEDEVKKHLEIVLEKAPEQHLKIVEERTDLGGEG